MAHLLFLSFGWMLPSFLILRNPLHMSPLRFDVSVSAWRSAKTKMRGVFGVAHTPKRNDKTRATLTHSNASVYWISIGICRRRVSFLSFLRELLTFDCATALSKRLQPGIIKGLSKNEHFVLPLGADGENKKRNNFYGERVDFIDS